MQYLQRKGKNKLDMVSEWRASVPRPSAWCSDERMVGSELVMRKYESCPSFFFFDDRMSSRLAARDVYCCADKMKRRRCSEAVGYVVDGIRKLMC
jgi:hypothetical protein